MVNYIIDRHKALKFFMDVYVRHSKKLCNLELREDFITCKDLSVPIYKCYQKTVELDKYGKFQGIFIQGDILSAFVEFCNNNTFDYLLMDIVSNTKTKHVLLCGSDYRDIRKIPYSLYNRYDVSDPSNIKGFVEKEA